MMSLLFNKYKKCEAIMNKKLKYILEQNFYGFNPADLNDDKPKKM